MHDNEMKMPARLLLYVYALYIDYYLENYFWERNIYLEPENCSKKAIDQLSKGPSIIVNIFTSVQTVR